MFFVSTVQSYDNPFSLTTRKLLFFLTVCLFFISAIDCSIIWS